MLHGMNEVGRRGWRPSWPQKVIILAVLLLIWTVAAGRWEDKGCQLGMSYRLVLTHGAPERYEGCVEEGAGRVEYTDDYYG